MSVEQTLRESAQSVLETMFFAESEPVPAQPAAPPAEHVFVEVSFHGHRTGKLSVGMPEPSARALASGFEGLADLDRVPAEKVHQVAAELANIICGTALTHMDPRGLFTLNSPELTHEFPAAGPECSVSECWLQMACPVDGVMHLALALEKTNLEKAA